MVNGYIPESSLLLGIIPALILLYVSIKGWQGKFKDKIMFIMFIIGIVSGTILAVIQVSLFRQVLSQQQTFPLDFLILFPFLEQIVKTIVLNMRRFQGKQETIVYGLGLGLGFGSIYPPALLLTFNTTNVPVTDLWFTLFGSLGLIFIHGATGALIGYGVYQIKIPKYYLYSVLILLMATLIRFIDYQYRWVNLVIGILIYIYVQKRIIGIITLQSQHRKRPSKSNP
jgi:hypothetical protein